MAEKVKVSCINCGATNNYPMDASGKSVVCGRCKTPLPQPGTVIESQPHQLRSFLQNAKLPILIDFFSPTCAPCHMMHPILEGLAKRRAGELMVLRIDVSVNPELSAPFGVQAVPTFIIIHKGYERGRTSGAMGETDFSLWVASKI
jgi:thioredoxin 2